ncbi:MAG: alpha-hydroxy-acid oxidizing protein, partial [Candidatus Ranarchaeia archaeon]
MVSPTTKKKTDEDIVYYRNLSRKLLTGLCTANKVCDGDPKRICMGQNYGRAIGFGGAGQGKTFFANFKALENIRLHTKLVKPHQEPVLDSKFLENPIAMPVLVSS